MVGLASFPRDEDCGCTRTSEGYTSARLDMARIVCHLIDSRHQLLLNVFGCYFGTRINLLQG